MQKKILTYLVLLPYQNDNGLMTLTPLYDMMHYSLKKLIKVMPVVRNGKRFE
ncbi:hypothetical protein [Lacrimispora algidixylanolytica]|uniref:hypothetical protein n=1 Tax=Lacrimispora algidixylanolytica TaxID=94868 RepID=UPI001A9B253B|nr:hypothetical protein [Lacrimispora algidixylanolytica]